MDKYNDIKTKILEIANKDEDITAIVAIGSYTRKEIKADEFSDLDLLIVTKNTEKWLWGEYPEFLGNVSISFVEPTLGGGKERRCIYDDDRDVDMIILTPEQFEVAIKEGVAQWVMNRGYDVMYDSMAFSEMLKAYIKSGSSEPDIDESEFLNVINDFYFHNIWAFKKLKRGELWSAKTCVDSYLKKHLLRMIELFRYKTAGVDVWHDGRFLESWDKAGALIGVLGMDISVDTLIAQVENIRVYETGFACLLDENGKVVSHPKLDFGSDPVISVLPGSEGLIAHESSGGELIRYTVNGEERQMSFSTLSNGMKLIVTAPESEVMAGWTRLIRNNAFSTVVITLVFAAIIMIVMRFMTMPLLRLAEASRRLADEDYDAELLAYSGHDEIGTLTGAFKSMRDRIKSYIGDLNRKVNTDDLTGLPNMRRFFTLAEQERDRLLKYGRRPAMIFFDLIGMKLYNRQYGFSEGDKLIRSVGKIIASHYGENCVCHYSDDHFAAVGDMETLEARLKEVFRDCEKANGGNSLPVRVGVYPHGLEEVSVSIACDRAKYACDRHRSSFVSDYYIFDESMSRQLEDVRYLINHLDQALEERWITVYYQPIVRAASGRVCDEEALSRWIDPVKGMISPGVFIPILERARLIYKLDLYMLDRILEKMKEQARMGLPVVPHSVNLSREDFDSCDIVEEVRRRVDEAGIGHELITVEVTESMVGSDFEFMKEQIRRFQELGFAVWMDDFGSGYSSLDVLQDIRFDLLKFDMRFMHRFSEGRESRIILGELMNMASRLGIETVCEGVETEEQLEFLRGVGCTKIQGFYYSKPIPFEEIAERGEKGTWIGYETGKR